MRRAKFSLTLCHQWPVRDTWLVQDIFGRTFFELHIIGRRAASKKHSARNEFLNDWSDFKFARKLLVENKLKGKKA